MIAKITRVGAPSDVGAASRSRIPSSAQRHEEAVSEVEDVHQSVDQGKSGRREEVDSPEGHAAEGEDEENVHAAPPLPGAVARESDRRVADLSEVHDLTMVEHDNALRDVSTTLKVLLDEQDRRVLRRPFEDAA